MFLLLILVNFCSKNTGSSRNNSTINITAKGLLYVLCILWLSVCMFHLAVTIKLSQSYLNAATKKLFTSKQWWTSTQAMSGAHTAPMRWAVWWSHRSTCLFCSRYWAFWIWSCVPVMVMMRSSEPSSGSSILMDAPDSWRICLILWPPLPMMEPASCKTTTQDDRKWSENVFSESRFVFFESE